MEGFMAYRRTSSPGAAVSGGTLDSLAAVGVGVAGSALAPLNVKTTYVDTSIVTPTSIGNKNLKTLVNVGTAGSVAATGSVLGFDSSVVVANSAQAGAEHCPMFAVLRYDQGTGFASSGMPGRGWLADWTVHSAIDAQHEVLNGVNLVMANYYDGQPTDSPMGAIWLQAHPSIGGATDATHAAATTYSAGVGLGIVGVCSGSGRGWDTAIQIGGSGGGWEVAASVVGEGINARDYDTVGVRLHAMNGSAARAIIVESAGGPVMIGDSQAVSGSNFTDAKLMVQWNDKPFSTTSGQGQRLHMFLYSSDSTVNTGAAIGLGGNCGSSVYRAYGYIAGRKANGSAGDTSGYLQFATHKTSVGSVERMRIDDDGVIKLIANSNLGGLIEMGELSSDAAAPAADLARLYVKDNGSGKTQLVVRFPTGAVQVLATEP